jgi:uncharacterized protein (DUF1697 family)
MRYAILLRGVNAGGNHRVPKGEFQRVLEGIGFRDVTVYINSGNAVCTSDKMVDAEEVQTTLENHFGFSIPTLVLSGEKVKAIAAAIPDDWTNDAPKPDKSGQKSDVLYLFDEINTPDILVRLGHKPDIETMYYVDGAVITNITRANQAMGSLQKVISTGLYAHMTVRNVNTARKLAELIG